MSTVLILIYIEITNTISSSYSISINASNISNTILWNPYHAENTRYYNPEWIHPKLYTNKTIKQQYPFINIVKFAYGTGGCYIPYNECQSNIDLLTNPSNSNSVYNFTPLSQAIENVIKQGLIPYIVTGNIPISYSNPSNITSNKINLSPPFNYNMYGNYIFNLAKYLINKFGFNHTSKWIWGVFTEFNFYDHFRNPFNINKTKYDYFSIYDYTECNLKKAYGNNNFTIGVHANACNGCNNGTWNSSQLLNHIFNEPNNCTNVIGKTQINFFGASFYEHSPGNPGNLSKFNNNICIFNKWIKQYDYNKNIDITIDEGRILFDLNGTTIHGRSTGMTYQASWDSLFYINMIRCNVKRFVRWSINTNGIGFIWNSAHNVGTINPISERVIELIYKLDGVNMINNMEIINNSYYKNESNQQIFNGISGIDIEKNIIKVFLFNHNTDMYSQNNVMINKMEICGLKYIKQNNSCNITEWLIDDNNSQFFNLFLDDVIKYNITSFPNNWSKFSEMINLTNEKERYIMKQMVPKYQNASQLVSITYQMVVNNFCVKFNHLIIPTHGVRLYEIHC